MRTLIVYYSKYGTTRQYANWIREATGADLVSIESVDEVDYEQYDCIVFGSFVMAGTLTMKICSQIVNNWNILKDKRIALYSVSGESPWSSKTQSAFQRSLPVEYRRELAFFPLGGRVKFKTMKFWDKLLLKFIGTAEVDEVNKEGIKPLIKYIRSGHR